MKIRRKGVVIVNTKKGILLVSKDDKKFTLPGGGAKLIEPRKKAAIRELKEETGLTAEKTKYLFSYIGNKWENKKGKNIINLGKVFLVETKGTPKPGNEIKYLDFWKPNKKLELKGTTKTILDRYMNEYSDLKF